MNDNLLSAISRRVEPWAVYIILGALCGFLLLALSGCAMDPEAVRSIVQDVTQSVRRDLEVMAANGEVDSALVPALEKATEVIVRTVTEQVAKAQEGDYSLPIILGLNAILGALGVQGIRIGQKAKKEVEQLRSGGVA